MAILEWKKEDTVAVITLTNGENRHNPDFVAAFLGALDEIEKDPALASVVILSGDAKSWSQGIDLTWMMAKMQQKDIQAIRDFMYGINSVFKRVLLYPMPVIACLNGHAAANGAILACACDFRLHALRQGVLLFPRDRHRHPLPARNDRLPEKSDPL